MDRLNQLKRDPNNSSNSSIVDSSLESHEGSGFETANESSSSKYFSFIADDPSLQDSTLKDVSLVEGDINDSGTSQQLLDSANAASMLSQLSPVNKSRDSIDFKIDSHIDAANILSGGVNIFDDNDNSGDENDLVIDDNALSLDTEEDCTPISDNNPILLCAKIAESIKDHDQKLKTDDRKEENSLNNSEMYAMTGSKQVETEHSTAKIEKESIVQHSQINLSVSDTSAKDHDVKLTKTATTNIDHANKSVASVETDIDKSLQLVNIKTRDQNIVGNDKAGVLQNVDILPVGQNKTTEDIKKEHGSETELVSIPNSDVISSVVLESKFPKSISEDIVPKQNNTNVEAPTAKHSDNCEPDASNNLISPAVQHNAITGNILSYSLIENTDPINIGLTAPHTSTASKDLAADIQQNTDNHIMGLTAPQNADMGNVAELTATQHSMSKNNLDRTVEKDTQNTTKTPLQNSDAVHVVIPSVREDDKNIEAQGNCNIEKKIVLSSGVCTTTEPKHTDASNIMPIRTHNVDAGNIPLSTAPQYSDENVLVSDENVPVSDEKNKIQNLDTVNVVEPKKYGTIAISNKRQIGDAGTVDVPTGPPNSETSHVFVSVASQNAEDKKIVDSIAPHNFDADNIIPTIGQQNVQNHPEVDNITHITPVSQPIENVAIDPKVEQKCPSENNKTCAPGENDVDPTAQQNDDSVNGENVVEGVVQNPAVGAVEVDEPPNVLLRIDGRNVVAVDVGNNLYLYRKETDDEVTAVQIVPVENEQPQCKFLNVRHNEEGNFEVYEEHIMEFQNDADQNNEVESTTKLESHGIFKSDDVKNLEAKPSHLPKKDLNKVISFKEPSCLEKGSVRDVSLSATQHDKTGTSHGATNSNNSVPQLSEDKQSDNELIQQHKNIDKPKLKHEETHPGLSAVSRETFQKAVKPIFSSTPKAKLTMKKEMTKSDKSVAVLNPIIVKPIPNLIKMNETSTSSKNLVAKTPTSAIFPTFSNKVVSKDTPIMEPNSDVKIKLQNSNIKQNLKLDKQDPIKLNYNVKPITPPKSQQPNLIACQKSDKSHTFYLKSGELVAKEQPSSLKLNDPTTNDLTTSVVDEQRTSNLKSYRPNKKRHNSSSQSCEHIEQSQDSKPNSQIDKPPHYNFKTFVQLNKQQNPNLKSYKPDDKLQDSNFKSGELVKSPQNSNLKRQTPLGKTITYKEKSLIPLNKPLQSKASYTSLDNTNTRPYPPMGKPCQANLKILGPVEKQHNANSKSCVLLGKPFKLNSKCVNPQNTNQTSSNIVTGKQSNSNIKHFVELGIQQKINLKEHSVLEKPQNYNIKSHLPLEMAKNSRLTMEHGYQLKTHSDQVGVSTKKNSPLNQTINMPATKATNPVLTLKKNKLPNPFHLKIEPLKKNETIALAHSEPVMQAGIASQTSVTPQSMDLGNNVYNDTYISEALNVKIQSDTDQETKKLIWGEKQIRNNINKGKEPTKSFNIDSKSLQPLLSNDNIKMDTVSVSVSVLPARHSQTTQNMSCNYAVTDNKNYTIRIKDNETVQTQKSDTTVTAISAGLVNSKMQLTNKNVDDKKQTEVVIVNLSESSVDGYSEEEISESQPVTGDIDWEAREKALTDKRDSEYIENVLHTIEESISKMDKDKPQPRLDTTNTILLNTALHDLSRQPPVDISILPTTNPATTDSQLNKTDAKGVITEVDFDKFVRRNSRHAPEDRITLQLPVQEASTHFANTLPGSSETKSNVKHDKVLYAQIPNSNQSNITPNSHIIPTKVYPTKTVPAMNATNKYGPMMPERYIPSKPFHKTSGKPHVDSIQPSSYLAGVQKVNESFKFKRAYQSALASLQTKDNDKPTSPSRMTQDKPVTVVILDPEPVAVEANKVITGLALMARSTSPMVAANSAHKGSNSATHSTRPSVAFTSSNMRLPSIPRSISSMVAVSSADVKQNITGHNSSPTQSLNLRPDLSSLSNNAALAVTSATPLPSNAVTTSPASSESTLDSSTEERTIQKSKQKHPRKQVLTSVERLDMEIVFPNLSELDSRNKNGNHLTKGRKRKVEDSEHTEVPKQKPMPYHEQSTSGTRNILSKNEVVAKESTSEMSAIQYYSENSISNPPNTISEKLVTQDKVVTKNREGTKYLSTKSYKDIDLAENNERMQDKNAGKKREGIKDATKQRDLTASTKESSQENEIKKGRGRPRKSITSILPSPGKCSPDTPTKTNSSQMDTNDFDPSIQLPRRFSVHSDHDYSSDDDQVIINWSMGKINENIVCPICSKLFRSENVVFKHVKHCTGPDKVVSPDEKTATSKNSESFGYEETASTPIKRPRGRPSHKQVAKCASVDEAEGVAESSICYKNENTELNNSSVVIIDSPKLTNLVDTLNTVTQTDVSSCVTNENSKTISDISSKDKNIKSMNKLSLKCDPPTPLTRLAKVMKVPAQSKTCFSCETCGKSFRQLSYLTNHRRSHHQSQPSLLVLAPTTHQTTALSCEVCKKGFRKLHHLVQHREIHKNSAIPLSHEDPNRNIKESRLPPPLVVNKREVSKLAPTTGFRCEACDKSFRKLYHLVEHRETHDSRARLSAPANTTSTTHSAPLVPYPAPLITHNVPLVSHSTSFLLYDAHAVPLHPHNTPHVTSSSLTPDVLPTVTVPNCEICGKTFRKLHHLIEHRDSHMVSKDIPDSTIKTTNAVEKPTLLAKDIIHECSHCYMVFPNEPSLNKHIILCQRKKRSQSSRHSSDPTIDDATEGSQFDNTQKEVFPEAFSKSIPSNHPSVNTTVLLEATEMDKVQQSETEMKSTSVESTATPIISSAPPPTSPKEESAESDDSEIIFNVAKSVDCDVRYMINPLFEKEAQRIPTKRASMQSDSTDRLNKLHRNVSRRTSVPTKVPDWKTNQHSPPKKSKKMPSQSQIKLTTSKSKFVNESVRSSKAQSSEDEDTLLYSFPNRRTSRSATSAMSRDPVLKTANKISNPNIVSKCLRSASTNTSKNTLNRNTLKPSEKRKSLVGIAKRKNAALQEMVSKAKLRRCGHNLNDRAGLSEQQKDQRKRPAPLRHLCDCGELFSSAAMLARHTSMAHTPPRIRRPRDVPLAHPPARSVAHQGVPIPHNMRKAVSGIKF